jgi:hypothetical protein
VGIAEETRHAHPLSSSSAQREKALVPLAQARPVLGNLKTKRVSAGFDVQ